MSEIIKIQNEVDLELSNPQVLQTLVSTTFKGLQPAVVKQAMVEGMIRGFKFKDFLEKNVYAIPFKDTYSLVTSIDHARKIGFKSGIVGKGAPEFETDESGNVIACSITVKRKMPNDSYVGEFTAKVYMAEYMKTYNNLPTGLWASKPRTMLAKVAEMHALRMACPEELAQSYVEEEMQKPDAAEGTEPEANIEEWEAKLKATTSMDELSKVWPSVPPKAKVALEDLKNSLKKQYAGA